LARSQRDKASGRKRVRYLAYAIPLIALAGVAFVYALTVLPSPTYPAAMDYTFKLLIEVANKNSTAPLVRAIAPGHAIGESGGYWASTQYNNDSVDSTHYPVYMDDPSIACTPTCLIHVKSRFVHQFTLGDFFNVWGYPLGENNTISVPRNGSFAWEMCIGPDPSSASISTLWGAQPLQPNIDIKLYFFDTVNGTGCAAS
jgi:hypothetical protein